MKPDLDQIQRLGFEAWADNLIVNTLEDGVQKNWASCWVENDDLVLMMRFEDGKAVASVRAYVEGKGWMYHDRTIKLEDKAP